MAEKFSLEDVKTIFPGAVSDKGEVVLSNLCVLLAEEVSDLKDQMAEKDFQILRITERIDELEGRA
ncbi:MAG: hypothetical protein J6X18_14295 [Bacteroidales bacterium]|nr:hypothetical protein [Bacteroidales bacterium]